MTLLFDVVVRNLIKKKVIRMRKQESAGHIDAIRGSSLVRVGQKRITCTLFVQNKHIGLFILSKAGISSLSVPEARLKTCRKPRIKSLWHLGQHFIHPFLCFLLIVKAERANKQQQQNSNSEKQTNKNKQTKRFPNVDVQAPRFLGVSFKSNRSWTKRDSRYTDPLSIVRMQHYHCRSIFLLPQLTLPTSLARILNLSSCPRLKQPPSVFLSSISWLSPSSPIIWKYTFASVPAFSSAAVLNSTSYSESGKKQDRTGEHCFYKARILSF